MGFFTFFANNRRQKSLANSFRTIRAKRFAEIFLSDLSKPVNVLDVGGTEEFWIFSGLADTPNLAVTLLNLTSEPVTKSNFKSIVGDACNLKSINPGAYDVIFSNSVIEHVGDFERQIAMAREIQRVGQRYFVQTPSPYFPIEAHFFFPFFALLPLRARVWLVTHFALGWYSKQPSEQDAKEFLRGFRLLRPRELRQLFPEGILEREKAFGFTKSYMVYQKGS